MHLRRALLLFAIVLGLAALAAAVSRPADVDDEPAPTTPKAAEPATPSVSAGDDALPPTALAFDASEPRSRKLEEGRAATVTVDVGSPGMVSIPELGLTAVADPLTPARFEVLPRDEGRYLIDFTPAGEQVAESAGTLVVKPADA